MTTVAADTRLPQWLRFVAPVAVGVILVVAWIVWVDVLGTAPRMVPSPAAIGVELVERHEIILKAMSITGTNALIGLAAGSIIAIIFAGLAASSRAFDGMLAPLVAAIAVVPIVALTPILNTMFGASSQFGRQAVAAIAVFVPVFVNVLRGLRQTRPVHRDLLRASAATPGQTFRYLTLPTALPYLMTGLRIASSIAVIAALVAEYFRWARRRHRHGHRDLREVRPCRARLGVRGRWYRHRPCVLPRDLAPGANRHEAVVGLEPTPAPPRHHQSKGTA